MSNEYKYYKLTPFKWFILENFPFIEADFDALTNYELFCKLGKEMNKIINAMNLSGEQVEALTNSFNELQTYVDNYFSSLDVQEEINNKLDEMAEGGTLAEIINQEIFTELNNKINTNIQNTDNNTLLLTDECKILFPYRGQNAGDCSIIQNNNKTIIIDLGVNIAELINYLLNNNITKIDYIILSHYHADHIAGSEAQGFLTLLNNENFDFSNLVVYLPHKGIDWSRITDSNKQTLQNAENIIKSSLTAKNIPYIEPDNEQILSLSNICNIKFLNIGSSFYNNYYGTYMEYNNFSMCCELTHNNRKVLYTGDIYIEAQENITPYVSEPDILKAPHHDLEPIASELFMKKLTSQIMVFEENQNYYGSGITTPISQTIKNNGGKIYDTNISRDINIILKNDNIISNSQNGVFTLQATQVLNSSGIHIPLNTDLNDLKDQGNYFTLINDETITLKHLPFEKEGEITANPVQFGRCKIINIGIDITNIYIKQFFISSDYMFYRTYSLEKSWSSWKNITNQNILDITDNYIANGSDLNNFYNIGKYEINNNTVLNSLLNCPTQDEGGSILLVLGTRTLSDLRHQILLTASNNIYTRVIEMDQYNVTPYSYSEWKSLINQ